MTARWCVLGAMRWGLGCSPEGSKEGWRGVLLWGLSLLGNGVLPLKSYQWIKGGCCICKQKAEKGGGGSRVSATWGQLCLVFLTDQGFMRVFDVVEACLRHGK